MNPHYLTCEYLIDPQGIDARSPRLSWRLQSEERRQRQTAYQVLVASTPELLQRGHGDLWDSGKVMSDQSILVRYEGHPLRSAMRCHWKVRAWDREGTPSAWSPPAFWSMGLLREEDWDGAVWIGQDEQGVEFTREDIRHLPARYLRREFTCEAPVIRATVSVCGLGFFTLDLNGKRVSDAVMDPALSDYSKTVFYRTFDVTPLLREHANAIGITLGNGRFFAPRLHTPASTRTYGFPKLLFRIELEFEDGSRRSIVSDEQWKLSTDGPIRKNNEYDGEEYDARREMPGWSRPGFDDRDWRSARRVDPPGGRLQAQMMEPMRITEVLKPVSIHSPAPGVHVFDMGRSFYGTFRMKGHGARGTEVRVSSAYSLLPDKFIKTADNRGALATDVYIFKGEGEEVWNPEFKGQGFRHIQVSGFPGTPTLESFEGLVIHSDMEAVGSFRCSHDLVNRIHTAMNNGFRSYLRSAPMEPDRDERQPWLGDPAKDAESEAYNLGVAAFYRKWLGDVARSQREDGSIPDLSMNWEWGEGVVWPSVFTIIPDWFADFYGDADVLKTHYPAMKRWVLRMHDIHLREDGTLRGSSYGDWCDAYTMDGNLPHDYGGTSRDLVETAYQILNCRILARAATRMVLSEDAARFLGMADELTEAFNRRFLDRDRGVYDNGTQTAQLLPLAFDLTPEESRKSVIEHLVHDILVTRNGHLSVGLVGMQWLMQTLSEINRDDVAWKLVTQTTRPSWGYMIEQGATTIWERWDTDSRGPGMNSENLLILAGNLDAWFYQSLAGIRCDPANPGFKHFLIKPSFVPELTWVEAEHLCPYGCIASSWKREGGRIHFRVTVPVNTTASLCLPTSELQECSGFAAAPAAVEGLHVERTEKGSCWLTAEPGSYSFRFQAPLEGDTGISPAKHTGQATET